jgi:hypothetical protein
MRANPSSSWHLIGTPLQKCSWTRNYISAILLRELEQGTKSEMRELHLVSIVGSARLHDSWHEVRDQNQKRSTLAPGLLHVFPLNKNHVR